MKFPYPTELHKTQQWRRPALYAFISSAFVLLFTFGLYFEQDKHERVIYGLEVENRLDALSTKVAGLVERNIAILYGLRADIAANSGISQARFEHLAIALMSQGLHVRHIGLAPDLIIQMVYPMEGNTLAIGLNYLEHPKQNQSVIRAIETGKIIMEGPVQLIQGGEAFITRVPVTDLRTNELWGVISAVIDYRSLFHEAGIHNLPEGTQVAIRSIEIDQQQSGVQLGDQSIFHQASTKTEYIHLSIGKWQIGLHDDAQSYASRISFFIIVIGIGASILVGTTVFYGMIQQVHRDAAQRKVEHQAAFDNLTGLSNRYLFNQRLHNMIAEAKRFDKQLVLMIIDLDNFKKINESCGHEVGDELLKHVAITLRREFRGNDLIARLSADEFAAVIKDSTAAVQIELVAERLIESLSKPIKIGEHDLVSSASIGIAIFPDDGDNNISILQHADRAMIAAKKAGRNTIQFFNTNMRSEADLYVRIHHEILTGIPEEQFIMMYQPILDIKKNKFTKCEALVRWYHPQRGMVSPAEFIPVAESTGCIRQLGHWCLERVCKDFIHFKELGFELTISVNRSVVEFNSVEQAKRWLDMMTAYQVPTSHLVFEITESLFMETGSHQDACIELLKENGIRFAIDDFGTGYSALNYLRRQPVDYVKIDQSFIRDMAEIQQDRALVESLIQLSHILGIEVIAEGVEYQEHLSWLQTWQCDHAQGFLFEKALPPEEFVAFLRAHQSGFSEEDSSQ